MNEKEKRVFAEAYYSFLDNYSPLDDMAVRIDNAVRSIIKVIGDRNVSVSAIQEFLYTLGYTNHIQSSYEIDQILYRIMRWLE